MNDDPVCGYIERQQSSASDGTNGDRFGQSVAIDGDTIVVGVPYDTLGQVERQGTAYVFVRNGSRWNERARLFPSDGAPDDNFGWSVAISGNYIVVGAPGNNIGAVTDQGAAYVYLNNGGSWFEQGRLLANDGAAADLFGYSVAISGENVAVGAVTADINGKRNQGAVYRFQPTGAVRTWTQVDKLTAEDGAADDLFGSSVALSGNVLLVGAPGDTIGLKQAQGSAHIFGDSNLPLRPHPKLVASDGEAEDKFGSSVAIEGGTVIVGAPYDRIVNFNRQGSASVFIRGGTVFNPVWLFQSKLIDEYYAAADDFFGISVALKGDLALVGASQMIESGKTFLFSRGGWVWTFRQKLTPSGEGSSDHFGYDVAFARDGMIIGAFAGGTADQGAFYFFENNCMVTVSAASYDGTQQAPESIVSGFGRNLSSEVLSAAELPLPTTLGDTRVRFYDSLGTRRFAPLFYVSPGQINFQVPPGTALGEATVLIDRNGAVAAGKVMIVNVAPGLFTANADGGASRPPSFSVSREAARRATIQSRNSILRSVALFSFLSTSARVPIRSFSSSTGLGSGSAARLPMSARRSAGWQAKCSRLKPHQDSSASIRSTCGFRALSSGVARSTSRYRLMGELPIRFASIFASTSNQ